VQISLNVSHLETEFFLLGSCHLMKIIQSLVVSKGLRVGAPFRKVSMNNSIKETVSPSQQLQFGDVAEFQRMHHFGSPEHRFSPLSDAHIADVFNRASFASKTNASAPLRSTKTKSSSVPRSKAYAAAHSRFFEWALQRFD
jgi:hypothetical protein